MELVKDVVPSLPNPGVWTMDQSSSLLSLNHSFCNKNKIAASVGSKRVRVLFSRNVFILLLSGRPTSLPSSNSWVNQALDREIKET